MSNLNSNAFDIESPEIQHRIIAKNELAFAFVNQMPIVPGHTLICPIRVAETCEDLSQSEWHAIIELKTLVCAALRKTFDAEGFNFAWNAGAKAGQSVPHFHLHVLPRKTGDAGIYQYEPRTFLYRPGTRPVSAQEELKEVARLIRQNL